VRHRPRLPAGNDRDVPRLRSQRTARRPQLSRRSDRVGLMLVAAGLGLMTLADVDSTWLALLPGLLVVCVGTGLVNPALAAVALSSADSAQSGLAAGVNDAFRQGGIAIGVAAFGALVPASAALGHGSAGRSVAGLNHALVIGAALAAVGGIVAGRLTPLRRTSKTQPAAATDPIPELG